MVKPREKSTRVPVHHRHKIEKQPYEKPLEERKEANNRPAFYLPKDNSKVTVPNRFPFQNYRLSKIKGERRLKARVQLRRTEVAKQGKKGRADRTQILEGKEDDMQITGEDGGVSGVSSGDAMDEDDADIATGGPETVETSSLITSTHAMAGNPGTISRQVFLELEEKWHQRYEKKNREIEKQLLENCRLMSLALSWETEEIKLQENFNLHGALERIAYHGRLIGKITSHYSYGVQAALDELAETTEFEELLEQEIATRHLVRRDVNRCVAVVYHEASKYAHGNSSMITIYEEDHAANERAALATFLGVQSEWPDGLKWQELKRKEQIEC